MSLFFYFWSSGAIVFVLIFSILMNWGWGLLLSRFCSQWILGFGVALNLLVLAYYKYAAFLAQQFDLIFTANLTGTFQSIILPIGISFFTFQAISYLVDIYRKEAEVETNVIRFGAYLSFFPQLIAGPIVRYRDVIAQYARPDISVLNMSAGFARFAHGLFKKVVIADSAGAIADACFALPADEYTMATSALGAIAYTVQIYFDFSGYSDMAIGLGLIFGIRFNENFTHPYSSSSLTEFWRRWHISLSSWFRDYLYIPLGGNRSSEFATYRNLVLVFAVTGLWHGAAWTFVVWGLYHGFFLLLERKWLAGVVSRSSLLARYCYMLPVVVVGWIIFRADTLAQGHLFIEALFMFGVNSLLLPDTVLQVLTPFSLLAVVTGCLIYLAPRNKIFGAYLSSGTPSSKLLAIRLMYCAVGLPYSLMIAFSSHFSPFLYFRF
ncbi:MAG: MBOAT family protein [Halioglobus sp.]